MKHLHHLLLVLIFCISSALSVAQNFPIGRTTVTFNDPARSGGFGSGGGPGRQIQTEIYYPATSAGINAPLAAGEFPLVVFAHGFVMSWDAYQNIWDYFVPKGFILAFPRTEGGFSPSHNDFALDMRVINDRMAIDNNTSGSFFYQALNGKSAFMGHSMGGGASMLAASGYTAVDAVVGLAPAETNPSAIGAAAGINQPSLVFSGAQDGVTPPPQHHQPIYNSITAACKHFVSITGGAHCYFANSNINCDFGEATSSTGINITRAQQQTITQNSLLPWLNYYLKGVCSQWTAFDDLLTSTTQISVQSACNYSALVVNASITDAVSGSDGEIDLTVSGSTAPYTFDWSNGSTSQSIANLSPGNYSVIITTASGCSEELNFTVSIALSTTINSNPEISFFPNPAKEKLFWPSGIKPDAIRLMDVSGRVWMNEQQPLNNFLDVSQIAKGVYLLEVELYQQRIVLKMIKD